MLLESLIAILGSLGAGAVLLAIRLIARRRADPLAGRSAFSLRGDVGDSMTHLCLIDAIRRNGNRRVKEMPNFLLGKKQDYPALFHLLLSHVPRATLEKHEWLITPLLESLHVFLSGIAGAAILARIGVENSGLWAGPVALLWGATPLLLHADRRLTLSERPFGFIFTHGFFVFGALWWLDDRLVWLICAAICGAVVACASKFGIHAITLISIALALLHRDLGILTPLAVTAIVAVAATKGYALEVARGTWRHSAFYRRHLMHIHDYVVGVSYRRFVYAWKLLLQRRREDASVELQRHPIGAVFLRFSWLLPLCLATAAYRVEETPPPAAFTMLAWAWASLTVCVLTSMQAFKYLGEGHRYVELAVLPGMLSCFFIPESWGGLWWLVLGLPAGLSAVRNLLHAPGVNKLSPAIAELLDFTVATPSATFLTIPGRLAFPIAYESGEKHLFYWLFINAGDGDEVKDFLSLFADGAHYPYPGRAGVDQAARRFGVTRLVVWLPIIDQLKRQFGTEIPLDDLEQVFHNGEYAVYALPDSKSTKSL
jgi:hypothetical protein